MKITQAEILDFRNLTAVSLRNTAAANLIVGRNAQGKTNLLEALYMALQGGSFRLSSDRGVIRAGESVARASVVLTDGQGETLQLQAVWSEEGGRWLRRTKINGVVKRSDDLVRQFPCAVFSPEDIDLLRLSPQYRRRFLDKAISAVDPHYHATLNEYGRVLRQRNQLLLMIKQGRAAEAELDVWDEQIAQAGTFLIVARRQFVAEMSKKTTALYKKLFDGQANIDLVISYTPSLDEQSVRNYGERLQAVRNLDIVRATTTKGPHRDDVVFWLGGRDVRTSASRGEFRSIVLVLKLAEGGLLFERSGERPIYFLDDVLSELDEKRRSAVAQELSDNQLWLTSSDESVVELFDRPTVWRIEEGKIILGEQLGLNSSSG